MKKFIYLFLATIAIISAIFMSGYLIDKNTAEIYVYTLTERDADSIVSIQGKLQYGTEKDVSAECNCIIDKVSVTDGDKVNKGDVLFTYYEVGDDISNISVLNRYDTETISLLTDNISLLKKLENEYEIKTMYAKSNGVVSEISISDGEYTEKNKEILKITDKSSLEIPVNISETIVSKIKLNQKVKINFAAIEEKTFLGTVTDIAEEAKQTTGLTGKETTVEVTISLNEDTDELRAGYSANCSIVTSTENNILIVPYECIRSDGEREYVYIVSDNKAIKRYIETGTEYKDGVWVKSGLKKGDIVIKNCDLIYDGQSVNVIDGENVNE